MFLLVGPTNQFSFTWKGPEALRSRRSGHLSKVPTFPQKSPFPPSLRGLLPKKERKKDDSPFSPKGRKRKGKKGLSFSSFFFISLSLYLSWEGKERVHAAPGLGFRHIINTWISKSSWIWVIILLFIYLFIYCSNDFYLFYLLFFLLKWLLFLLIYNVSISSDQIPLVMSISILKCQFSQMLAFRHLLYYAFPFELACILTYLFCMSNILISLLFLQIYTKRAFFFMALLFHDFIYFLLLFFFWFPSLERLLEWEE